LASAGPSVVFSFVIEAFVDCAGGRFTRLPGGAATEWTHNRSDELQTFCILAFAFKITPELLVKGIIFWRW